MEHYSLLTSKARQKTERVWKAVSSGIIISPAFPQREREQVSKRAGHWPEQRDENQEREGPLRAVAGSVLTGRPVSTGRPHTWRSSSWWQRPDGVSVTCTCSQKQMKTEVGTSPYPTCWAHMHVTQEGKGQGTLMLRPAVKPTTAKKSLHLTVFPRHT